MSFICHYSVDLTFQGPLLTQAPGVVKLGIDNTMLRYRDEPVLPGSLVRGNIRHAMDEFVELIDDGGALQKHINDWFGRPSDEGSYRPERGALQFDFYWQLNKADSHKNKSGHRSRIAIDSTTGTVKRGALQVIEEWLPSGSEATFTGTIRARFGSGDERRDFEHWLRKALDTIPAMGSYKGIGFGRIGNWGVTPSKSKKGKPPSLTLPSGDPTRFGITLRIDRPFCVGRPRTPDSNRIVSEEIIPGTVIKGVLAEHYSGGRDAVATDLQLDALTVSHLMPVVEPQRPTPLPLSLAFYEDKLVDMATLEGVQQWQLAPLFQPDWKDKEYRLAEPRWGATGRPDRLLTVRTAIEHNTGVAKEAQLFSQDCIDPYGYLWCGDIELFRIDESKRQGVINKLIPLLQQGITGIGKTQACAKVELGKPFGDTQPPDTWQEKKRAIVTLVSDARLLPHNLDLPNCNGDQQLMRLYQSYWSEQVDKGIVVERYFAQQRLASPWYYHKQHLQPKRYHPEWLTVAGSVFVLRLDSDGAWEALTRLLRTGLPAHPYRIDSNLPMWKNTPWLPENGYGEIVINDPKQVKILFDPTGQAKEVAS